MAVENEPSEHLAITKWMQELLSTISKFPGWLYAEVISRIMSEPDNSDHGN